MDNRLRKKFGKQLKKCRKESGLRQQDIANVLYKSASVISRLEKGYKDIAIPNTRGMDDLLEMMRDKVSKAELEYLKECWKEALDSRSLRTPADSNAPLANFIDRSLKDARLDQSEHTAMEEDIHSIVRLWLRYLTTKEDFDEESRVTFEQAAKVYKELINEKVGKLGSALELRLRLERVRHLRYMGQSDEALDDLDKALIIAEKLKDRDPDLYVQVLIELGNIYRHLYLVKWPIAKGYYEKASEFLDKYPTQQTIWQATIERKIAGLHLFIGDPIAAMSNIKESHKAVDLTGHKDDERKILQHEAWAVSLLAELDKALELQRDALKIAQDLYRQDKIHTKEMAKSHRYMGDICRMCGLYEKAEGHYKKALSFIEITRENMKMPPGEFNEGEKFITGMVKLGLGAVYAKNWDEDLEMRREATENINESVDLNKSLRRPFAIGLSYSKQGKLSLLRKEFDTARQKFTRADHRFQMAGTAFFEKRGDKIITGNPYYLTALAVNWAKVEFMAGKYADSRKEALKVIDRPRDFEFPRHRLRAQLWLAKTNLFDKNPPADQKEEHEPLNLYFDSVKSALKLSFYLLCDIITMIDEQIKDLYLSDKDGERALNLWESIQGWPLVQLEKSAEPPMAEEKIGKLRDWLKKDFGQKSSTW